jgi:DNA gyrase subunit A
VEKGKTLNITEKTGKLISINAVTDADDLVIQQIRTNN